MNWALAEKQSPMLDRLLRAHPARSVSVQDGHSMLMVLTLTLGLITPPVGVCLFVACRIGDLPISALVKALIPFFVAQLGVVILIILLPGLSSWLPRLFH